MVSRTRLICCRYCHRATTQETSASIPTTDEDGRPLRLEGNARAMVRLQDAPERRGGDAAHAL